MSTRKKSTTVIAITLFVCCAVAAIVFVQSNQGPSLEQAQQAFQEGRTTEGRQLWEEYLHTHADDHANRIVLAKLLIQPDVDAAINHLQQIPESSEQYAEAIKLLAVIGITNNLQQTAQDSLLKLLELDPNDPAALLALSEFYFHSARFKEALPVIRQTLEIQSDRAETHILLAETLSSLGRHAEMVEPLQKAIELDRENITAHSNLAFASLHAGDPESARSEANWCLSRDPARSEVRQVLASALRDLGLLEEALREIGIVLNASPSNLEARLIEAQILMFQHKPEQVYINLAPFLEQHGDNRKLVSHLARAAAMSGRMDEARELQQKLQSLIPTRNTSKNY